jgi:HEAT repeat protein
MELFGKRKPNVKALARGEDIEGLVDAATFQDLVWSRDGETRDRGAGVREQAILALGELSTAAGNGTVAAALSDPSDRVRTAAVRVLYAREQAAPLVEALRWLPAHRGTARRLAIEAIAELNRPEHARALAAAIVRAHGENPPGEDELELLAWLFGHSESSEEKFQVIDELLSALADEREAVAERAEQLLAWLSPAALNGVIAELESGCAAHRAASVLGRVKDSRALEPLLNGLEHREARVRAASAAALGELRDPAAVEPLMRATRDSNHEVRAQAGWALDRIGVAAVIVGVSLLVRSAIQEALSSGADRPALENGRPERTFDVPAPGAAEFEGWALDEAETVRREAAEAAREAAAAAIREAAEAVRDETSEAARRDIEALVQQFANAQAVERAAAEAAQREATAASARAVAFIRSAERQLDDLRTAGGEMDAERAALPSSADGVSSQVAGYTRFYERAEIKDALAYLTLLVDSSDTVAFSRVVNSPRRGIGATSLGRLVDCASATGKPVWDVAAEPESVPGLAPTVIEALGSFISAMERLREQAEGGASVGDLLTQTLEDTGYTEALQAERTTEAQGRLENLEKLVGVAREYDATADGAGSVEEFLQQLAPGAAPSRAGTGGEEADADGSLDGQSETATVEASQRDATPLGDGDETSDWVDGDLQLAIARAQLPGTTEFRVLGPVRSPADIRRRFAWKTDDELATCFAIATEARTRTTMDGSEAEAAYWKVLVRVAVSEAATRPDFGNFAERDEEGGRRERRLREKRLRALADARQAALREQRDSVASGTRNPA